MKRQRLGKHVPRVIFADVEQADDQLFTAEFAAWLHVVVGSSRHVVRAEIHHDQSETRRTVECATLVMDPPLREWLVEQADEVFQVATERGMKTYN